MIIALLAGLTIVFATGLFAADDGDAGPYAIFLTPQIAEAVSEVHEALSSFLLFLIVVHVLGVLTESLLSRKNLVRAMWTGIKRVAINETESDAHEPPVWRLILALALSIMGIATVIWGAST